MLKAFERGLGPRKPGINNGLSRCVGELAKGRVPAATLWLAFSMFLLCLAFLVDAPVARVFTLGSSNFWRQFAIWASKAGEGWVVGVAGIAGSLTLFLLRRFTASRRVFLVAFTGLITGAAATILRSLLGRTRPDSHEVQGFYGVWHDSHWIIGKYEFGAFPSGHVATVIGLAAAAWLIDRRFGALAAFYAVLVSWSRIALGCHHFSDAVASGILGIYGAQLILTRLGPSMHYLGQHFQNVWSARLRLPARGQRG